MSTERTWEIRDWNCTTQSYDASRTVTLEQFKAENKAKCEAARDTFRANVATVRR